MSLYELIMEKETRFEEVIKKFNDEILPNGIKRVNEGAFKLMSAKLPSEKLPTNQRNLTDARTRIGTLLEYTLAVEINNLLKQEYNLESYDVGFVLANQYPDLVIRNERHEAVIRLEVKTIQGISEEKSANFDALVRNIRKNSDIVCVMLWEWEITNEKETVVEFPKIHEVYAFNAYDIARLRDEGWLGKITSDNGIKLIDISGVFVPTVQEGKVMHKEEEGNLGKLLRINSGANTVRELEASYTPTDYTNFKKEVVSFGIEQITQVCFEHFKGDDSNLVNGEFNVDEANLMGYAYRKLDNTHLIILGGNRQKRAQIKNLSQQIANEKNIQELKVLVFNDKFDWDIYTYNGSLKKEKDGNKPELAYSAITPLS